MGITAVNVCKAIGDPPTQILSDISIQIPDGQFLALTGRSGSGKSTLLYLLSGLDSVSTGTVSVDGLDLSRMKRKARAVFRNKKIGFVFQFNYLIAELSVIENVLLPAKKYGEANARLELAQSILKKVGRTTASRHRSRSHNGAQISVCRRANRST